MKDYIIKPLAEKDFEPFYPLMAEIEIGSVFDSDNKSHMDWLRARVKARYASDTLFFAMYTTDGDIVGLAGLQLEKPIEGISYIGKKCELVDIAIVENLRGRGYGTELLRYIEDVARKSGAYVLYAATSSFDCDVIYFYGKNKLVPIATLTDVYGPGEDGMLYMRKIL